MVKQRNGRSRLETEGLFIVEAIVDRRRVEENRLQYLIKWKDYPSSHNTWEYAANVAHCREIIAEFRESRLSEGFVDSEDEGPPPPPPQVSPPVRKRRRKRKSETSSACHSRMSDMNDDSPPTQTPIPQSTMSHSINGYSNNFSLSDPHHNALQLSITSPTVISIPQKSPFPLRHSIAAGGVNLNNACKIFAATFNSNGKYFCTLFLDGSKFWISNEHCRKYLPQLLLDYYENCSVFIDTMDSTTSRKEEKQTKFMQEKFVPYERPSNMEVASDQPSSMDISRSEEPHESGDAHSLLHSDDTIFDDSLPLDSSTTSFTSVALD